MNNIFGLMQSAKNPQAFMQNLMNNSHINQNPIAKNALEMYQRGDLRGINELADNLCKERGINRQDIEKEIRSKFGI
jgi:hypothetical protein